MSFHGETVAHRAVTYENEEWALIDRRSPDIAAMENEEQDAPRLADGLHCAVARYVLRLDGRDCAAIGRDYGVTRQWVNALAVKLCDRLGLPTERPPEHRERKKRPLPPRGNSGPQHDEARQSLLKYGEGVK